MTKSLNKVKRNAKYYRSLLFNFATNPWDLGYIVLGLGADSAAPSDYY